MTEYIYDKIPYDLHAFPFTHPRNVAAIAIMYGMKPGNIDACRVLELGCAAGGNLIPQAFHFPNSHFVGIDNSEEQIKIALTMTESLNLSNIEFHCIDMLDFDPTFGKFDYIVTHGVYSWAPAPVQDKILKIFKSSLNESGIAFVNYATYPGAYTFSVSREIMRYKTRSNENLKDKLNFSRQHLKDISNILPAKNDPYLTILARQISNTLNKTDSYLLHDDLGEIYDPVYFHEFVKKAEDNCLQYVGDADFISRKLSGYSADAMNKLHLLSSNTIEFEQHVDFLSNQGMRNSLLCHSKIQLSTDIVTARLSELYLSSFAQLAPNPNGKNGEPATFRSIWGNTMYDPDPLFQQAIHHLINCYPDAVTFKSLINNIFNKNSATPLSNESIETLATRLLIARSKYIISISIDKPKLSATVGNYPTVSDLTRLQGNSSSEVTSLWHENIGLDEFNRKLLSLLDGQHNLTSLQNEVWELYKNGELPLKLNINSHEDDHMIQDKISEILKHRINFLAWSGLLISKNE